MMGSYERYIQVGVAKDPIHVGTGGARLGQVDLTIVRDPATQLPKIPGSSLAGVYRTYVAMCYEEMRNQKNRQTPFYPNCAGLGQPREDGAGGHCGQPNCPVCTVFGFARGRGQGGGFAGLAAFTDAQILLFPVPTRRGPYWVTCPSALQILDIDITGVYENAIYQKEDSGNKLNLGWLYLDVKACSQFEQINTHLKNLRVPDYIRDHLALIPDQLFSHVVNCNLEVRTSVSISPETGAAEERALFSYEALPRSTVLVWEIITRNPKHFKVNNTEIRDVLDGSSTMSSPEDVYKIVQKAHPYIEHLGIGGMSSRGMGRVKILYSESCNPIKVECDQQESTTESETSDRGDES